MGWRCCGSFLRYSFDVYSLGTELYLRDFRKPTLDCSDLLWSKACRASDRRCRRHRIGRRALKNEVMWTLAAAAFIAIFFFRVPFPLIIISAALIGSFGGKWKRDKFLVVRGHGKGGNDSVLDDSSAVPEHAKPLWNRALRVCITWILLWCVPVILLSFWLGSNHTVVREGIFFSIAAMVTFGGDYAFPLCGATGCPNVPLALRRSDARRTWTCRVEPVSWA